MHTLINNRLLIRTAKCLMAVLIAGFVFSTPISANEAGATENALLAYSNKNRSNKNSSNYKPVDSWKPYFTWIGNVQDQDMKMFTQMTVGIGFLYFADNSGRLNAIPGNPNSLNTAVDIPIQGKIGYNRSPVFDFVVGYRIFNWLKGSLAFEHQGDVHVQTDTLFDQSPAGTVRVSNASIPNAQLRSNLSLNALLVKAMFELPWPMIWKSWMYTPYFNVGVGPGWQSWTDVRVFEQFTSAAIESTFVNTLNQKYPASAVWQLDAGFRTKAALPSGLISFLIGCKFTGWGQARNIGLQGQQGEWPFALFKPFRVKFLYSFVPYVGAQWNF